MRSDVVVVVPPERQFAAGIIQSVEDLFIQQLVSQAAIGSKNPDDGHIQALGYYSRDARESESSR